MPEVRLNRLLKYLNVLIGLVVVVIIALILLVRGSSATENIRLYPGSDQPTGNRDHETI